MTAPWMKWLLVASLALNLAIAGAAGGIFVTHGRMPNGPDLNIVRLVTNEHGLPGFVRSLPAGRKAEFKTVLEEKRRTLMPLRMKVRDMRKDASVALAGEPFDPSRIEAAMDGLHTAEQAVNRAALTILLTAMNQMTPEERAGLQVWRRRFEPAKEPMKAAPAEAPK